MAKRETHEQKMSRVAKELGDAVRRQASGKWSTMRMGERDESHGHAFKFRPTPGSDIRYLRVTHKAMGQPVPVLMEQLQAGRWLDRLTDGPETSLVLHEDGRLEARAV